MVCNIEHTIQITDILSMKIRLFTAFLGFFALSQTLFGAEITVPHLDLVSQGKMENGDFTIASSLEAEIAISGGYKYGFSLGLGAEISDLGKALSYGRFNFIAGYDETDLNDRFNNMAVISIRSIEATVREVFNLPLEISFFIGHNDKLGSGDEFQEYFGSEPIGTAVRGFFYYPDGLNEDPFFRFNGAMHSIMGTGLAVKGIFGNLIPALYIYHDLSFQEDPLNPGGSYAPGHYSADIKLLVNGENAKFEVFFGGTYATSDDFIFRGGALAWFGSGAISFLMQAGITSYEFGSSMKIDNCYFLMEPRLRFDKFGVNLTFFYHPVYFMNKVIFNDAGTDTAKGNADINLRVFYGNINKSAFEAGLETLINLEMEKSENAKLRISPFISTVTTGLRWDFALRFNPLFFQEDEKSLLEGFIGIRTSY